jgi:hypothetical protein
MSNNKKEAKEKLQAYITQLIPELRNPENTLQPLDYNPYSRLGPVPPNEYSYWNRAGAAGQEIYFDPAD